MEENNKSIVKFNLDDYELYGGDGLEEELWVHMETGKIIAIPITILRDFDNIDFR